MLHFQCHNVPKCSLNVNYLSLTVVLGVQEGIELKLPLTMESRDGHREGKKRGGSSSDQSLCVSHPLILPALLVCLPQQPEGNAVATAGTV